MKIKGKTLFKSRGMDTHAITILSLMCLVLLAMALTYPTSFFTLKNVKSMIFQMPEYGILALGMMVCMIAGGIDLSLVGIMNLAGVVAAIIVTKFAPAGSSGITTTVTIVAASLVAILIGAVCGAFNGFIIGYFKIPAMLVTLCGLQLYTGLAYGITGGPAINGMNDAFKEIANGDIFGIPYVLFIFIAVVLLVVFTMKSTIFGHEVYFVGSNAVAAKYSGIDVLKTTIKVHAFSGIMGGISGILITSHLNSAKSSNGATYTLLTLLIVVLGGVHPDGGRGRVSGVVLATVLLQLIANAFGLMYLDDNAKTFANGILLVAALLLDVYLDKRRMARIKEVSQMSTHENNKKENK